jgi:hypothetical protein
MRRGQSDPEIVMINARIASTFEHVATLLGEQGGSPYRVRAWRDAARTIAKNPREMADVFHDHGRVGLEALPHIGPRLASVVIEMLRSGRCRALERLEGEHDPEVLDATHEPSVELLLDIDREYRNAVAADKLVKIAPRHNNPRQDKWLPIMHTERDGFAFTVMFSNTAQAHRGGHTHDWVVIYFHEPHGPESQATVVTEQRGPLQGRRVVRGRERECEKLDDEEAEPLSANRMPHARPSATDAAETGCTRC